MFYHFYDMQKAMLGPARFTAAVTRNLYRNPFNPLSHTQLGRTIAANAEMFERLTKRFGKPEFALPFTEIDGKKVSVTEEVVHEKPFCNLLHFRRDTKRKDPKVLVVAPMSGHYATLLRGTVEALLPHHDVYITDWLDARLVRLSEGRFNLDDYIAYVIEYLSLLGPDVHVIAVCQPAVPVYAAACIMEAENDPNAPATMTLMGGPIDTRISMTQVNELAENRPIDWFESQVVLNVPPYYPGAGRRVYPGFIQLGGFMSMNLDRHVGSHMKFYQHLVNGDGDSAEAHRKFYNEYLSVMDITAEFYLQTVETVFQKHSLPKGEMVWHDPATNRKIKVDPSKLKKTALLTIEGEMDDISAHGQTTAAHTLATNLPASRQFHHFQKDVGHYGIFNGRRWRQHIMPRLRHFIREFDKNLSDIPAHDLKALADKVPAKWDADKHLPESVRRTTKSRNKKADA